MSEFHTKVGDRREHYHLSEKVCADGARDELSFNGR
jgi:hypothetical protein